MYGFQKNVLARRMEKQQPPHPIPGHENERQEESTDVSAAPAKKRRLVDILRLQIHHKKL